MVRLGDLIPSFVNSCKGAYIKYVGGWWGKGAGGFYKFFQ